MVSALNDDQGFIPRGMSEACQASHYLLYCRIEMTFLDLAIIMRNTESEDSRKVLIRTHFCQHTIRVVKVPFAMRRHLLEKEAYA
jgi:hypothetical protein